MFFVLVLVDLADLLAKSMLQRILAARNEVNVLVAVLSILKAEAGSGLTADETRANHDDIFGVLTLLLERSLVFVRPNEVDVVRVNTTDVGLDVGAASCDQKFVVGNRLTRLESHGHVASVDVLH